MNTVGEPCAGKPHARFDEGRLARRFAEPVAYSTRFESTAAHQTSHNANSGHAWSMRLDSFSLRQRLDHVGHMFGRRHFLDLAGHHGG